MHDGKAEAKHAISQILRLNSSENHMGGLVMSNALITWLCGNTKTNIYSSALDMPFIVAYVSH